jgi:hypothetical protein
MAIARIGLLVETPLAILAALSYMDAPYLPSFHFLTT